MKIAVAAGVLAVLASGLQTPTSVPYRELGRTVQIVRMFEEPLGTKLTLTGHRFGNSSRPSMMGGGNFRVETVNGRKLKQPLALWVNEVKTLPSGAFRKLIGYETGGMIGAPSFANREYGTQMQAGWQFRVELKVLRVLN